MSEVEIMVLALATLNLVPISIAIYYGKSNLALGLALVEVLLVLLGSTVP